MNPLGRISRYGVAILAITCVTYFIENLLRTAPSALTPILIEELSLTYGMAGALISSYFLLYALMQVPSGVLSDALGPRRTILSFTVFTVVGVFLFYLGRRLEVLMVAQLLIGLGSSVFYINAVNIISNWFPPERRASAIGVLSATSGLGNFAAYIGFPLSERFAGWRTAYLYLGLLLVANFAANFFILRDRPRSEDPQPMPRDSTIGSSLVGVLRDRRMYPFFIGYILDSFSWVFLSWLPQFLTDTRGFSYMDVGLISSVGTVAGIPGCVIIGLLSDRLRRRKLPLIAFSAAYTCLLAAFLVLPGGTPAVVFAAVAAAIGFSLSLWVLFFSMVPETLPPERVGIGLGLVNGVGNLGFALIAPTYGSMVDASGGYALSNGMLLAGGLLMTLVFILFIPETYGGVRET